MRDKQILHHLEMRNFDKAFELLYKEVRPELKRFFIRHNIHSSHDQDDLWQETVFVFYNNLVNGKYKNEGKLRAYLIRVLKNIWLQKRSKVGLTTSLNVSYIEPSCEEQEDPFQEKREKVKQVVGLMKNPCKDILTRYYYVDKRITIKQLATKMGYTENSLRKQLQRCRNYVRNTIFSTQKVS